MKYDNPYRDAALDYCDTRNSNLCEAISDNEEYSRVMSDAAYDVFEQIVSKWFTRPGVVCCKLDIPHRVINIYVSSPTADDHLANFRLPLAELMLSAAHTAKEYVGLPPSDVSAMLREMADEIDKGVPTNDQ